MSRNSHALELDRAAERPSLQRTIEDARDALIKLQSAEGYWLFELEADCTIPAEYVMMMHFLDQIDAALECKIAVYLREHQAEHGGWPLYHGGELNISCTVKSYFALKLAGDSPNAAHMVRARTAILAHGGAARANVFTRIALALFGELPWRGVPHIPVEIMLLPRWFPFHLDKVSYWSRTVMVPLFILCTYKPRAKNPRGVHIGELFTTPPEQERDYFHLPPDRSGILAKSFLMLDRVARLIDPLIPKAVRRLATARAENWLLERLNGEDGLGAIFPAMVNALEVMVIRGYPSDDPRLMTAKRAIEKLLVIKHSSAYCQPCVSPVWDTGLASLAMQEVGGGAAIGAAERALHWVQSRQLLEEKGDWQVRRPHLAGGGWAFQFSNDYYPDLDDTAVIVWAMHRANDPDRFGHRIDRALDWLAGMQSSDGGFGAFDVDNNHFHLNQIPFADHGALLDPPTSDVTARVITALTLVGRPEDRGVIDRAVAYLRKEQTADGAWFGRWGTNYVYGTWSVLMSLSQAGIATQDPAVRRAVAWLDATQNADGGWGESNDTYSKPSAVHVPMASTPYQTAWAVLALIAADEIDSSTVRRGVDYLLQSPGPNGLWTHPSFTAPGFPRVFYLKYHGYCAYFPLWALAAYRNRTLPAALH